MEDDYTPISCGVHDQLLAFATLKRACEITATDGDEVETIRGIIVDVYSRGGAEYLRMEDGTTIRLDRILTLNGEPVPAA